MCSLIISLRYVFALNDLILRQTRWLELLKDYDMSILYHQGKANIVSNALSRLSIDSTSYFEIDKKELAKVGHKLERLGVHLLDSTDRRGVLMMGLDLH